MADSTTLPATLKQINMCLQEEEGCHGMHWIAAKVNNHGEARNIYNSKRKSEPQEHSRGMRRCLPVVL